MSRPSSWLRGAGSSPEPLVPTLLGGLFGCYLAVPFVAFVSRTGVSNVVAGLSTPEARVAIRNSLLTAPVATLVATTLGVPLAYVLARRSFRGKRLVELLVVLPLVVPPVVGGAMLLTAVGRFTPLGAAATAAGIPLTDSLLGVVLAQTFVAGPFVVITARAGFAAVDRRFEEAARSLGYGPLATVRRVSLPLARGTIIAGVVLTFARALGEFGATLMVAYNARTMPTQIWVDFIGGGIDAILPLGVALLAVAIVGLTVIQRFGQLPALIE